MYDIKKGDPTRKTPKALKNLRDSLQAAKPGEMFTIPPGDFTNSHGAIGAAYSVAREYKKAISYDPRPGGAVDIFILKT